MKEGECSRNSAARFNKEQQEKRFLKIFDGICDYDNVIIIGIGSRRKEWEIEIRLPSGCIRRRNNKNDKKK